MDVKELQARLAAFAAERGWDELHNPRNLAIALAGEAGMLLDLFRWLTDAQSQRIESQYKREAAEEAIADLLLHTLRLADKLGVDVERAVAKKLAENDANYPPPVAEPAAPAPKPVEKAPAPVEEKRPAAPAAKAAEKKPPPPPEERKPPPELVEEKKVVAPPVEEKKAVPPPAAVAPEPPPPPREAKRALEPAKPPEKPLPTWLDGIMPARSTAARKKSAAAPKAAPEPPPPAPKAPEVAPAPEAEVQSAVEEINLGPPLADDEPEPVEPPRPPEPERYAHLDTDVAKAFVKSLAKRVDGAKSDDPLLRELHDEVETLRRTLYSPTPKYQWMGDSLVTIRDILQEATTHSVGEELRARDYIAQIERMLGP